MKIDRTGLGLMKIRGVNIVEALEEMAQEKERCF